MSDKKVEIAKSLIRLLELIDGKLDDEQQSNLWRTKCKLKQLSGQAYECLQDDGTWVRGRFSFDGPQERYRECDGVLQHFVCLVRDEDGIHVAASDHFTNAEDFIKNITKEDIEVVSEVIELKAKGE